MNSKLTTLHQGGLALACGLVALASTATAKKPPKDPPPEPPPVTFTVINAGHAGDLLLQGTYFQRRHAGFEIRHHTDPFFPGVHHLVGIDKKQQKSAYDHDGQGDRDNGYRVEKFIAANVPDRPQIVESHKVLSGTGVAL